MAKKINTDGSLAMQLIAGTNKHLANSTQILITSGTFTSAQVLAQLQALVTLSDDVNAAKAALKAKLAVRTADTPALRIFMDAYVSFVRAAFSKSPDVLADFGLTPKKARAQLTSEEQAAAVAKRAATRAARHTMGSQQKKAVKGAVTGVVVTPVVAAPSVVTVPPGPSAPASSTGATAGATPRSA